MNGDLSSVLEREWDAAVVGAGPSGSLMARQLALAGLSVVLIDKARFPRAKVCGCCLSGAAVGVLRSVGLGELPGRCGGIPTRALRLSTRGARAELAVRGGMALSRQRLDAALAGAAVDAGAMFLPAALARIGARGELGVRAVADERESPREPGSGDWHPLRAYLTMVCDGLAGTALGNAAELKSRVRAGGRIGAAAMVEDDSREVEPGVISMSVGAGGYVGVVRVEDGRLNMAAAFDPAFVKECGGPGRGAARILADVGHAPLAGLAEARWHGTPALTRRRARLEMDRVMIVGDAAGYVEPFTGEGMAWALGSAVAAAPIAIRRIRGETLAATAEWTATHRRLIAGRQWLCRGMAMVLRHPVLVEALIRCLGVAPGLAGPLLRRVEVPVTPLAEPAL